MSLYNSKAPSQSLENCSPKLAASDLSRAGEDDAGWQISGRSAKITVFQHWVIQKMLGILGDFAPVSHC